MIIIVSIAGVATGGTELLHQLYWELKTNCGASVRMAYLNQMAGVDPVPERFRCYDVECVDEIDDDQRNFVVIPESCPDLLKGIRNAEKGIWWLSVDNYLAVRCQQRRPWLQKYDRILSKILKDAPFRDKRILHFSQSRYSTDFLSKNGVKNSIWLSDFISKSFIEKKVEYCSMGREDVVLYNPHKGYDFTRKLMDAAPDIEFFPIRDMLPEEISEKMMHSKVYIDFGHHPGKDRIPREASLMGCLVLTGKKGSAAFREDVPIPEAAKFDDSEESIPSILARIRAGFLNYDQMIHDYDEHRRMILEEPQGFQESVASLWKQHLSRFGRQ